MVAGELDTASAPNAPSERVIADDLEFAEPEEPAPVAVSPTDIVANDTGEEIAQDDIDALFN